MNFAVVKSMIRQKVRAINTLLFVLLAVFLLFPFYAVNLFGFTSDYISAFGMLGESFWAILLFLAPILGLVFVFALSGGKSEKSQAMQLFGVHAVGLLILLFSKAMFFGDYHEMISYGFGAALSILVCILGLVANALAFLDS